MSGNLGVLLFSNRRFFVGVVDDNGAITKTPLATDLCSSVRAFCLGVGDERLSLSLSLGAVKSTGSWELSQLYIVAGVSSCIYPVTKLLPCNFSLFFSFFFFSVICPVTFLFFFF